MDLYFWEFYDCIFFIGILLYLDTAKRRALSVSHLNLFFFFEIRERSDQNSIIISAYQLLMLPNCKEAV